MCCVQLLSPMTWLHYFLTSMEDKVDGLHRADMSSSQNHQKMANP